MKDYLAVGYIFTSKGLNGEVKVKPLSNKDRFTKGSILFLSPPLNNLKKLTILKSIMQKDNFVIQFKEIDSIDKAKMIKDSYLQVKKESLDENEYYIDDLVGLEVYSDDKLVGKVSSVAPSLAHDILVVKGGKEFLVPVTKEFIKSIDLIKKKVLINTIKGLLELWI